eukprot:Seg624.5 transcript_id=Seg624.5/GoldUCD/mRNA.D3Y31 product="hypothetical protein" protein_id=Seg624.5/GoldUCD/D3Y31
MKNTTSDASIVNNEETAHSPDRGSLELSRRNDQNVEDVILTIAMNDEQCLQIIPNDAARHHRCSCHGSKIQLIHLLTILSFLLFVIAAVIVEVYGKGKTKDALRRFLHIFRSVSMLTFLGQASFLVAVKFSFSNLLTVCCERNSLKDQQLITQILKRFIMCTIFEEIGVRNYFQRVNVTIDYEEKKGALDYITSSEIDDLVSTYLSQLYASPEGAILEMIGADKTEIHSYAKLILQQILSKISPEIFKSNSASNWQRAEVIRSHVEEIVNQQLHGICSKDINKLLKAMFKRKLNKMSLIIFIFAVLIGSLLEVIRVYALTNTIC